MIVRIAVISVSSYIFSKNYMHVACMMRSVIICNKKKRL